MRELNVLSLFDGISCGRIALDRTQLIVKNYYASEIDKFATQISEKNYPDIIRLGDVVKWREWDIDWGSIDLIIGGSPCQSFSSLGKGEGFDGKSGLFYEYVNIMNKVLEKNPKAYFLLENVVMKNEWKTIISEIMGVEPILIDSSTVSMQKRRRLYWTNIPDVKQPHTTNKPSFHLNSDEFPATMDMKRDIRKTDFFSCLTVSYSGGIFGAGRPIVSKKLGNYYDVKEYQRQLTVNECEILQTLPIDYTEGVSKTQRYRAIGNGWTVDVIAHIFKNIK